MQPAPQLQEQQQQAWPGNTGPQHLQPTHPPTQPPQPFWPQLAPSSHTTQQQHGALQQRSTSGQIYTHNQQHPQQEAWGSSGRQAPSSSGGFLGAAPAWISTNPLPTITHSAGPASLAPATNPLSRYLGGRSGRPRGFNFRPPPGLVSSSSTRIGSCSAGADANAASRLDSSAPHNLPQVSAAPPHMQPGSLAAEQSLNQHTASALLAPQVLPLQPPFQHPPPAGPALSGGFMGAGDAWPGRAGQPAVALTSAGQPARKPAAAAPMPKSLKRRRAEAAANVSYSFDPTPQPQKPMAQTTLQQALRRHTTRAAATADRQQQGSAEQQSTQQCQRQQQSLPDSSGAALALASARTGRPLAELPWPPLQQQQPQQGVVHNTLVHHQALDGAQHEQAGPWPAAAAVSLVHSPIERCTGTNAAPQPCRKAPLAAGAGADLSCNPVDAADRRQKLRYLLAADADPFSHSAASNGRRWEWLREPCDSQGRPPSHPDHDPTTLLIPASAWTSHLKGADAQYWRIKRDGCAHMVLFFQEGNFYHLKDRDADVGMQVGLQAMGGSRGSAANMWTVGCVLTAFNEWAAKVLALGYVVGRVDEDKRGQREPGTKLIKRTLTRIYSPGTLLEAAMLEADTQRSMLQALLLSTDPAEVGFASGQLAPDTRKLLRQLGAAGGSQRGPVLSAIRYLPPCDPDSQEEAAAAILVAHTGDMFVSQRGRNTTFAAAAARLSPHAAVALQLAIQHLVATGTAQRVLPHCSLACRDALVGSAHGSGHVLMDACAIRSLELLANSDGKLPGSLLHFLDRAATAAGRRKIEARLATTELFMRCPEAANTFQAALHRAPDCERLLPSAADVLASVVEHVAAAEEAEDWAGAQQAQAQQAPACTSAWAAPRPRPPSAAQQHSQEAGRVAQLAAVLDLSQGTFLPVVQLLEGAGLMLAGLHTLHCTVTAQGRRRDSRGSCGSGPAELLLPPPLQRAVTQGEVVAAALRQLCKAFDAGRFEDAAADIALEEGLCAGYDSAAAQLAELQAAAAAALDSVRAALRGRGHSAAILKKVKLVAYREEQLVEVPTALRRDLEASLPGCSLVKEAQTVAKYRVAAVGEAAAALEAGRDRAKLCVLRYLSESAGLFLSSCDSFRHFFDALSTLDVLAGFAAATHPSAAPPGCTFCRPTFEAAAANSASNTSSSASAPPMKLRGVWSPALLASCSDNPVQANDVQLGGYQEADGHPGMLLLTGANAGGKSTLLRASCLAAIMAQVGCYVPAAAAEMALVDRVFTRIGAHDRLFQGESTFLVEMMECSSLLRHSTPASLVVLDEVGRGTATHDGHAIAFGVALWLARERRCRCLFATHHHGLCREGQLRPLVQLAHMQSAVEPGGRGLLPSFRLASGPAPNGSCGVLVAAACQLPPSVIARAAKGARTAEQGETSIGNGSPASRQPRQALPLHQTAASTPLPDTQQDTCSPAADKAAETTEEQREVLEMVRAAVRSALQGGDCFRDSFRHLQNMQVAVREALASGEL
ncbi:DNA mismatch repair protein Msh6 [Chlorella vulgaris]